MKKRALLLSSLLGTSLILLGCGSDDETQSYRLVPVTGTVTLNGKPLEGAQVTFTPDAANKPATPGDDVSGPEGNYKVMFRGRAGLAPGKYKVVVSKDPNAAGAASQSEDMKDDPFMASLGAAASAKKPAGEKIEASFDREVPAGGGVLDFDVKGPSKRS